MERNTATNTFRLGSLFGVTIAVHFTWFVIFALITFSMTGTFAASFPGLPRVAHLLIGVVASLLISDLITKGSSDRARSFASKMHLLHRQRYVLFGGVRTGF